MPPLLPARVFSLKYGDQRPSSSVCPEITHVPSEGGSGRLARLLHSGQTHTFSLTFGATSCPVLPHRDRRLSGGHTQAGGTRDIPPLGFNGLCQPLADGSQTDATFRVTNARGQSRVFTRTSRRDAAAIPLSLCMGPGGFPDVSGCLGTPRCRRPLRGAPSPLSTTPPRDVPASGRARHFRLALSPAAGPQREKAPGLSARAARVGWHEATVSRWGTRGREPGS